MNQTNISVIYHNQCNLCNAPFKYLTHFNSFISFYTRVYCCHVIYKSCIYINKRTTKQFTKYILSHWYIFLIAFTKG